MGNSIMKNGVQITYIRKSIICTIRVGHILTACECENTKWGHKIFLYNYKFVLQVNFESSMLLFGSRFSY